MKLYIHKIILAIVVELMNRYDSIISLDKIKTLIPKLLEDIDYKFNDFITSELEKHKKIKDNMLYYYAIGINHSGDLTHYFANDSMLNVRFNLDHDGYRIHLYIINNYRRILFKTTANIIDKIEEVVHNATLQQLITLSQIQPQKAKDLNNSLNDIHTRQFPIIFNNLISVIENMCTINRKYDTNAKQRWEMLSQNVESYYEQIRLHNDELAQSHDFYESLFKYIQQLIKHSEKYFITSKQKATITENIQALNALHQQYNQLDFSSNQIIPFVRTWLKSDLPYTMTTHRQLSHLIAHHQCPTVIELANIYMAKLYEYIETRFYLKALSHIYKRLNSFINDTLSRYDERSEDPRLIYFHWRMKLKLNLLIYTLNRQHNTINKLSYELYWQGGNRFDYLHMALYFSSQNIAMHLPNIQASIQAYEYYSEILTRYKTVLKHYKANLDRLSKCDNNIAEFDDIYQNYKQKHPDIVFYIELINQIFLYYVRSQANHYNQCFPEAYYSNLDKYIVSKNHCSAWIQSIMAHPDFNVDDKNIHHDNMQQVKAELSSLDAKRLRAIEQELHELELLESQIRQVIAQQSNNTNTQATSHERHEFITDSESSSDEINDQGPSNHNPI